MNLRKFSEIEQFRHVVADVIHSAEYIGQDSNNEPMYDKSRAKPVLTFKGTVKLHGTNCGVAFDMLTGEVKAQSHFRYLSAEDDNFGFCAWINSDEGARDVSILGFSVMSVAPLERANTPLIGMRVFGEWCGPTVNGKTAIGQLPLRWVVFGVLLTFADGREEWMQVDAVSAHWKSMNPAETSLVHFITDYPRYSIDIDFNQPEASLDELERLTLEVEAECPVAKAHGIDGGLGEGIVWENFHPKLGRLTFKTKGMKHKGTRNSRIVQIEPEVLASMEAFTEAVLTESRLEQGFGIIVADHGKVTRDHIGTFLKWVGQDVLKEETDTMEASGLERQQVMGRINQRAKQWLMPRLAQV
ncbi:hypothetical protein WJ96_05545 [Burkholderia ubonensis]|uniref:RNA ligase domain-containing protein n=1 Tax=Burkholderia ubonensis TaxID=101571 RepID=A0AAW3MSZ5_9BURK|nr:RNA ligase family protein [Burkholderia ubonensis]KVP75221.1 hypothetical protein WJ93_07340 [Burkholderia ubonensis]KVP96692.1 hypothetical protein WJ97_12480 [Burkholderia ubonensis]KVP98034.1 hypothetical protein WJ96_05545 [Burkholderia ubonensis]KVZ92731.1 hypothetical protein WL25_17205 [Burkholderia ubonensis]